VLNFICVFMLTSTVHAEDAPLKGIKLGFGFDRGWGIVGTIGKFNGFIGNDGASVDYIFKKEKLNTNESTPLYWYIGGGGYGDWDGDFGVRLPVGGEIYFAKNVDAYAQIMPRLRVNNDANFGLDFAAGVRYKF
jgi:hypothetical protein